MQELNRDQEFKSEAVKQAEQLVEARRRELQGIESDITQFRTRLANEANVDEHMRLSSELSILEDQARPRAEEQLAKAREQLLNARDVEAREQAELWSDRARQEERDALGILLEAIKRLREMAESNNQARFWAGFCRRGQVDVHQPVLHRMSLQVEELWRREGRSREEFLKSARMRFGLVPPEE